MIHLNTNLWLTKCLTGAVFVFIVYFGITSNIFTELVRPDVQSASIITVFDTLVTNQEELLTALSTATGGETIALQPGNYGKLSLYDARQPYSIFPSEVTITSYDTGNLAVFSSIGLAGVQNLTFDRIHFKYQFVADDPAYLRTFNITNGAGQAKNITVKNSMFEGAIATTGGGGQKGFPSGYALGVDGRGDVKTQNITIKDNIFHTWTRGAVFGAIDGLVVEGNEVYGLRSDGMDFAFVENVRIEDNFFHDFIVSPDSGDHMDMIQFWTSGATENSRPNANITIRNNVLLAGSGSTQSIFMRNEAVDSRGFGADMFYQNVLIEDNVIYNAHAHGITVGEANNITVRNNTLLHNTDAGEGSAVYIPTIHMKTNSTNMSITKNIIAAREPKVIPDGYSDNLYVQNASSLNDNFYLDLFVNPFAGKDATLDDLRAYPDSVVVSKKYGASRTRSIALDSVPQVFIEHETRGGFGLQTIDFEAKVYRNGSPIAVNSVTWKFDDGKSGSGATVSHSYEKPGRYEVIAKVSYSGGKTTVRRIIDVETPVALALTFDKNAEDVSPLKTEIVQETASISNGAARINNGIFSYARDAEVRDNKEYTLAFDFKKDSPDTTGRVIYYSGAYTVAVTSNTVGVGGAIKSSALAVNDTNWHTVVYTFDGATGLYVLYVDGIEVGSKTGDKGTHFGSIYHDFTVGNPFGNTFEGLIDNVYILRGALDESQVAEYEQTGVLPIDIELKDPATSNNSSNKSSNKSSNNPSDNNKAAYAHKNIKEQTVNNYKLRINKHANFCDVKAFEHKKEKDLKEDKNRRFPVGLFDMTLECVDPGATITQEIVLDAEYDTSKWELRKYSSRSDTYSTIDASLVTYAVEGGKTIISYQITDGGSLDEDGVVNGVIVDPVGPAIIEEDSGSSSSGGGGGNSSNNDDDDDDDDVDGAPVSPTPSISLITQNISFNRPSMNTAIAVNNVLRFLNSYENESLALDGVYNDNDNEAVKRFQKKYQKEILDVWDLTEATGYIGITTRLKMNFLIKDSSVSCPVFTEYNGGKSGIKNSAEIGETQVILRDLDMYNGSINNSWDASTNQALVKFQETFKEVMLDPWNITKGTGYKYKTTNKFLNYFAGCDTGSVHLEGVGVYEGI